MSVLIKFVPGVIAAVAAFWIYFLFSWIDGIWTRFLVFTAVYVIVVVALDIAMTRYGNQTDPKK